MDVMQDISPTLFIDYIMLSTLVDAASLDLSRQEEDSIVWTKTASGMYTAKSAYKMQFLGSVGSTFPTKV
jgi:hypothetical protein